MDNYDHIFTTQTPLQDDEISYNYDTTTDSKRDTAYLLFLLPSETRVIKKLVDEILDRLEYSGSVIYNEYPDKNQLLSVIEEIYSAPTFPSNGSNEMPSPMALTSNTLRSLTETIFLYEMLNRRRRYYNIINNNL